MKTPPRKDRTSIIIAGEDPLVAEYSELAAARGYDVVPLAKLKTQKSGGAEASIALELTNLDKGAKKTNLTGLDKLLPATTAIVTSSATVTVLEQSSWVNMKHRLVGVAALPSFLQRSLVEIAPSAHTIEPTVQVARTFFSTLGKDVAVVQDRVGMVLPRILCQLINEAMFAVQQEVAAPKEIDLAMQLGMNFPFGPLEWGEKVGFNQVRGVLEALSQDLAEERYRICPLLKEIAAVGVFWNSAGGMEKNSPGAATKA